MVKVVTCCRCKAHPHFLDENGLCRQCNGHWERKSIVHRVSLRRNFVKMVEG